jgi:hypothetical protein
VAAFGRGIGSDAGWWRFLVVPLVGAVVSIIALMLLMTFVNSRIKAADNEVFSAVHSMRYKHFLRMRIDSCGALTLFVVGLDPVGRDWFQALRPGGPRLAPPYDPEGGPRMHYVWGTTIEGPRKEQDQKEGVETNGDPVEPVEAITTTVGRSRPLTVYVAWHPADDPQATIGREVLTALQGDPARPAAERIGIPVRFRTALADASGNASTPAPLPIDAASQAVVAVVAGANLLADDSWRAWIRAVRIEIERLQAETGAAVRLVVLATSSKALDASDLFGTISVLRLADLSPDARKRTALISVLAAAADLLVAGTKERLRIFISHAKADGAQLAEQIDQRIAEAKLQAFLDSHDIVEGLPFDEVINQATRRPDGAAIAVVTDAYAGREWCRAEALQVKQADVPIVALDAVRSGQERTLPYLGNVPSVRLGDDLDATLDGVLIALLREVVRSRWFPGHVARLGGNPSEVMVMSRPPELLTVLHQLRGRRSVGSIMYPDPPLATDELAVLEQAVMPVVAAWSTCGRPAAQPRFVTPTTVRWKTPDG